jgi:hypothetical protein
MDFVNIRFDYNMAQDNNRTYMQSEFMNYVDKMSKLPIHYEYKTFLGAFIDTRSVLSEQHVNNKENIRTNLELAASNIYGSRFNIMGYYDNNSIYNKIIKGYEFLHENDLVYEKYNSQSTFNNSIHNIYLNTFVKHNNYNCMYNVNNNNKCGILYTNTPNKSNNFMNSIIEPPTSLIAYEICPPGFETNLCKNWLNLNSLAINKHLSDSIHQIPEGNIYEFHVFMTDYEHNIINMFNDGYINDLIMPNPCYFNNILIPDEPNSNYNLYREFPYTTFYNFSCLLSSVNDKHIESITSLQKLENARFMKLKLDEWTLDSDNTLNKFNNVIKLRSNVSWGMTDPRTLGYLGSQETLYKNISIILKDFNYDEYDLTYMPGSKDKYGTSLLYQELLNQFYTDNPDMSHLPENVDEYVMYLMQYLNIQIDNIDKDFKTYELVKDFTNKLKTRRDTREERKLRRAELDKLRDKNIAEIERLREERAAAEEKRLREIRALPTVPPPPPDGTPASKLPSFTGAPRIGRGSNKKHKYTGSGEPLNISTIFNRHPINHDDIQKIITNDANLTNDNLIPVNRLILPLMNNISSDWMECNKSAKLHTSNKWQRIKSKTLFNHVLPVSNTKGVSLFEQNLGTSDVLNNASYPIGYKLMELPHNKQLFIDSGAALTQGVCSSELHAGGLTDEEKNRKTHVLSHIMYNEQTFGYVPLRQLMLLDLGYNFIRYKITQENLYTTNKIISGTLLYDSEYHNNRVYDDVYGIKTQESLKKTSIIPRVKAINNDMRPPKK